MEIKQMLNALKQLTDEQLLMCKTYDDCSSCPCLLDGGFCELKLAITELARIVKSSVKGGEKDN